MKPEIKCVIFDIGGVLLSEGIEPVFDALNSKLGKTIFVRRGKLHSNLLKGKLNPDDYYDNIAKKTGKTPEYIKSLYFSTYTKIIKLNKKTIALAKNAKRNGYKIGIISNITTPVKKVQEKWGIFDIFSPVILSCDVGLMKPQRKIYQMAIKKTGLKPGEIVYTDDRKELLDAPKKLGMKTIHFRNAAQLKRDLRKLGVKI